MPFISGQANDFPALLTALRGFLTANGWTLSGDVLHKGDCHAAVTVGPFPATGAAGDTHVQLQVGNGIDGDNRLVDPTPFPSLLGQLKANSSDHALETWAWPVSYFLHVLDDPSEVWLAVKYDASNANNWQLLGFGQSPEPGNSGTGCWQFAPIGFPYPNYHPSFNAEFSRARLHFDGADWNGDTGSMFTPAPFFVFRTGWTSSRAPFNSYVHGVINSVTGLPGWSASQHAGFTAASDAVSAHLPAQPLFEYGLNTWNLESPLLRIRLVQPRPEAKTSIISTMEHARFCRNDYLEDGGIITLGHDRWSVYPFYRKNAAARGGGVSRTTNIDHSGTLALAIRYDGD